MSRGKMGQIPTPFSLTIWLPSFSIGRRYADSLIGRRQTAPPGEDSGGSAEPQGNQLLLWQEARKVENARSVAGMNLVSRRPGSVKQNGIPIRSNHNVERQRV